MFLLWILIIGLNNQSCNTKKYGAAQMIGISVLSNEVNCLYPIGINLNFTFNRFHPLLCFLLIIVFNSNEISTVFIFIFISLGQKGKLCRIIKHN